MADIEQIIPAIANERGKGCEGRVLLRDDPVDGSHNQPRKMAISAGDPPVLRSGF